MWLSLTSIAAATLQPRGVLLGKSEHEGYTITLNPLRARARFYIAPTNQLCPSITIIHEECLFEEAGLNN